MGGHDKRQFHQLLIKILYFPAEVYVTKCRLLSMPNKIMNINILSIKWGVHFISVCMLLMFGLQFMSCMPVMKMVYGLHDPKYLSDAAVVKYYNRLGLQDKIYRVKDYKEENRKEFRYLGSSMPEILVFNSHEQLTTFELNCSGGLDSIAGLSTHDIDNMPLASNSLQDLIGDTYVINDLNKDDAVVLNQPLYVVKFAEYAGLLNKQNVPGLVDRLSNRTDVQYILLNMDYTLKK